MRLDRRLGYSCHLIPYNLVACVGSLYIGRRIGYSFRLVRFSSPIYPVLTFPRPDAIEIISYFPAPRYLVISQESITGKEIAFF